MASSTSDAGLKKRPLNALELYFTLSHENFTDITCYTMTVAAKSPLKYDQVQQSLLHLYRKLPNLRARIWRDGAGQLWLGAMEEKRVLLQFLDDSHDPEKVHIEETRKQHAVERGPMWRVSVIPARGVLDTEANAAGFTHQYYVMFGFHHAITDGHSTIRTCGYFLAFLNAVIQGEEINDQEQLAEFVDDRFLKKLIEKAKKQLETDKNLRNQYEKEIDDLGKIEPLLFKAYPPTNELHPKTETIWRELDEIKTEAFLKRAKLEKITIHSAFCSVIQGAIVDLMLDAGFMQDKYQLDSIHDVNERRFWDQNGENIFGAHVSCNKISVSVPCDILNNFWENAKAFHIQFNNELQNRRPILMAVVESEKSKPLTKSEDFYKNHPPCTSSYLISNMGDITRFLKRKNGVEYEHVRAVRLRRTTCIHSYIGSDCFCVQTLNGKLLCSLDYNTRIVSHALAEKLLNKTMQLLGTVSQ